jgi:hypothetical protein
MIAFLVGWGVFWFLFWLAGTGLGLLIKDDGVTGVSLLLLGVSSFYLIAVGIGSMFAGSSC